MIPLFLTLNNLAPSGACSIGTCVIGFNSQVFFPGSSHTCSVIQLSTLLGGLILLIQLYNIYIISGGESGSADTARDPRGFAMKFYTEEGNWDLVGNNTPIFFIRDPILVHIFKINEINIYDL